MGEKRDNLWAPWRMEYIRSLTGDGSGSDCFLCDYGAHPEKDPDNHVRLAAVEALRTIEGKRGQLRDESAP